ncbi:MAG: hypothetical protein WCA96_08575, partial [Methylocella sp.]
LALGNFPALPAADQHAALLAPQTLMLDTLRQDVSLRQMRLRADHKSASTGLSLFRAKSRAGEEIGAISKLITWEYRFSCVTHRAS